MNDKVYLAIDLGASSGRVMAARFDGTTLEIEEVHRFSNGAVDVDGVLRWEIDSLWAGIRAGIAMAADLYRERIVSIGVDTWGVDYALLDEAGDLIDAPIAYRDARNPPAMAKAFELMPRERIYEITGIQFLPFNTAFQMLADIQTGRPGLDRARRLLFTPDLINYWLCGVQANEYTIASTGQLLDARTGTWSDELVGALGLRGDLLGELVQPGTLLGALREDFGLPGCRVVAVGSHDTASAVAAVPFDTQDAAYLSSGTWSLLGIEAQEPIITARTERFGLTNEGGIHGTIRVLKNICGLWLVQECRRIWAESDNDHDYAELTAMAEDASAFQSLIDPDHESFATPGNMPSRIREYCRTTGQYVPGSQGAVIRTALESLAHRYRQVLDMLEDVNDAPIRRLHIVGGGIQNRLLSSLAAGACGREVVTGPVEAASIGNALVQMMAHGDVAGLEQARAVVRNSFPVEILQPADAGDWESQHRRFLALTEKQGSSDEGVGHG